MSQTKIFALVAGLLPAACNAATVPTFAKANATFAGGTTNAAKTGRGVGFGPECSDAASLIQSCITIDVDGAELLTSDGSLPARVPLPVSAMSLPASVAEIGTLPMLKSEEA